MSDAKAKKAKAKAKPAGKDKKKGKGEGKEEGAGVFSVSANPRAGQSIRRTKGCGGLACFVIATYLSINAAVPIPGALERGLIAGAAGYLLAWACSVTIWRQLMISQLRVAAEQARAQHALRAEAAAAQPTIEQSGK